MKNFKLLVICALTLIIGILAGCASMTLVDLDWDAVQGPAQVRQGQNINPRDVVIYGIYKDGSRKLVGVSASDITFNKSTPGVQTVTVRVGFFNQQAAQFTTEVMALRSLTVASPPRVALFKQGTEADPTWPGLEIRGEWDQMGSDKIDIAACQVTGYMKDQAGKQTIRITYEGLTTTFEVDVRSMASLQITNQAIKTEYLLGEPLDISGLRVVGTWGDGIPDEEFSITAADITGYNPIIAGQQTISITKNGRAATYAVQVLALTGLSIVEYPTKLDYKVGEELDLTGIVINGNYTGGSTNVSKQALVPIERISWRGFNSSLVGRQTVTLYVEGAVANATTTILVTVTQ